ncbi:MAG: dentilisin complex subunit PrcA [Treponema sp.]
MKTLIKRCAAFCGASVLADIVLSCSVGTGTAQLDGTYAQVQVKVLDSVGGEPLSGTTTLTVYEAGTKNARYSRLSVENGSATLVLQKKQRFDFCLEGEKDKRAASTVENYYVKENEPLQTLTMFQREPQRGAQTLAPTVESVLFNGKPFADGGMWKSEPAQKTTLQVVFRAPSRVIQQVPNIDNFGCAFAIGNSATSRNSVAQVSPACEQNADGSWKCTALFSFDDISLSNETNTLVITAYDVAGNRVERHINSVQFKEQWPALKTLSGAKIEGFRVEMHRYPYSLRLFSDETPNRFPFYELQAEAPDGAQFASASTSHNVILWFRVKDYASQDLPIRGFNIYRRKQGTTPWIFIDRKQYAKDYSGPQNLSPQFQAYRGFHQGYDTSSSLEEGVTYEYMVSIFTDTNNHLESPIAPACLLPANTIALTEPSDNGSVKKSALNDMRFSFKLTNPEIWEKKLADYFSFGLLITQKDSVSQIVFAGKITADLKAPAGELLSLQFANGNQLLELTLKELKQRGWVDQSLTEDDLLTYKDGVVTIQPKYLQIKGFNHPQYQNIEYKTGYTYAWDIFNWGKKPADAYDDEPAVFAAIWRSHDKDGKIIPSPLSTSESFVNGLRYAASSNGQFYFKIADE